MVKESHPFILDNTGAAYRPVVQVIDNMERNHKLGLVFEFTVGQGRLLVVMSNLERAAQYPEGRQFYASVLNYMRSAHFAPTTSITLEQLHTLFRAAVDEKQLKALNNVPPLLTALGERGGVVERDHPTTGQRRLNIDDALVARATEAQRLVALRAKERTVDEHINLL